MKDSLRIGHCPQSERKYIRAYHRTMKNIIAWVPPSWVSVPAFREEGFKI